MTPGFLGKANPIYGIFPIQILRANGLSCFQIESEGVDMLLLHEFLNRAEIRHAGHVFLYKRIHDNSNGVIIEPDNLTFFQRLVRFFKSIIQEPMIGQYRMKSSGIESILYSAVYPVCLLHVLVLKIWLQIQK